jgi:cytidylate kinase
VAHFVVAIDGGAGSGKSTTARGVAKRLNFFYLDTGAMYRAFTLKYLRTVLKDIYDIPKKIDMDVVLDLIKTTTIDLRQKDSQSLVYLDGDDVTVEIRTQRVSNFVSQISAIPEVRESMVKRQREIAENKKVVCEGRDIGTVVFPDAQVKIYMDADIQIRAQRREKELIEKKIKVPLDEVVKNLKFRDTYDSTRKHSPLKKAQDAIVVNTTDLTIEQEIDLVEKIIRKRMTPNT